MKQRKPRKKLLEIEISRQPDDTTCGPTCLHALYQYYGDNISLEQVISEVQMIEGGGTLGVLLASHALKRGYRATIFTYNVQIFDPTWFTLDETEIPAKLEAQSLYKNIPKLKTATHGYLEFLRLGGKLRFKDINSKFLMRFLIRDIPILTGLSATYLYNCMREYGPKCDYDDVKGEPSGHFVVLSGYDKKRNKVRVADPQLPNPIAATHYYKINMQRVINSILLGIITYDANLLIIEPKYTPKAGITE